MSSSIGTLLSMKALAYTEEYVWKLEEYNRDVKELFIDGTGKIVLVLGKWMEYFLFVNIVPITKISYRNRPIAKLSNAPSQNMRTRLIMQKQ
jgi:hypothetical protein